MKQMLPKVTKNNKGRIFSEFRLNKLNKSGFQIQQNYGYQGLEQEKWEDIRVKTSSYKVSFWESNYSMVTIVDKHYIIYYTLETCLESAS